MNIDKSCIINRLGEHLESPPGRDPPKIAVYLPLSAIYLQGNDPTKSKQTTYKNRKMAVSWQCRGSIQASHANAIDREPLELKSREAPAYPRRDVASVPQP